MPPDPVPGQPSVALGDQADRLDRHRIHAASRPIFNRCALTGCHQTQVAGTVRSDERQHSLPAVRAAHLTRSSPEPNARRDRHPHRDLLVGLRLLCITSARRGRLICVRLVLMLVVLGLLSGCAARSGEMVPTAALDPSQRPNLLFRHGIAISRVGGGETNPLLDGKVGDEELRESVRLSLERLGFLSMSDVAAPFRLEAFLIELKRPDPSFTKIATAVMRYKLTRSVDGRVLYDDVIIASSKATFGDTFFGSRRIQLAIEGSIRANIAVFLQYLNAVENAN